MTDETRPQAAEDAPQEPDTTSPDPAPGDTDTGPQNDADALTGSAHPDEPALDEGDEDPDSLVGDPVEGDVDLSHLPAPAAFAAVRQEASRG